MHAACQLAPVGHNTGVAQQTFELADVLGFATDQRVAGVFTAIPGIVQSYDATKQFVDVQPAVYGTYTDENGNPATERLPVVTGCPVSFPGGGAWSFTWPISQGDTGLLVFCSSSIDRWLGLGGEVQPVFTQQHHISDAIFIPGIRNFAAPINPAPSASAMVLNADALQLGDQTATDAVIKGTTYRSAEDTVFGDISDAATAISVYAQAIEAIAEPTGGSSIPPYPITTALVLAMTNLIAALATFEAGSATYLSTKVTVS